MLHFDFSLGFIFWKKKEISSCRWYLSKWIFCLPTPCCKRKACMMRCPDGPKFHWSLWKWSLFVEVIGQNCLFQQSLCCFMSLWRPSSRIMMCLDMEPMDIFCLVLRGQKFLIRIIFHKPYLEISWQICFMPDSKSDHKHHFICLLCRSRGHHF